MEGAPAQVVGAKFKSRAIKGPAFRLYALGGLSFLFLVEDLFIFFLLADFWPSGPGPKGLVLPKGGGGAKGGGGGGRRCKHWPPGAGDPRDATGTVYD